ncbi:NUDIX hydrolase [Pseudidiomarina homiensis]|uniref:Nudix hydrolase domain-containing protein n=1 Tax=Pseudidiomarina homiensis TaxID=364198 RepID=A0A432Y5M9_9GAMM|nr:NUDIX hydrolase [Pseudidiomarina homiensis]RUO56233.1 hypothetical protein CWI70_05640 [Pseudidiomarina homiensis]
MSKTYRGDHRLGEIEILEEIKVFENRFATLYNDKVVFPSGATGEYLRFWWNAPYGVLIIATTAQHQLLLLRNFRHEDRNWQWEIPKGFGEPELTPEACAAKELHEETGFAASSWHKLHTLDTHGTPTHVFRATLAAEQLASPETSEAIAQAKLCSVDECRQLIAAGQVHDPITLYAITLLELEQVQQQA